MLGDLAARVHFDKVLGTSVSQFVLGMRLTTSSVCRCMGNVLILRSMSASRASVCGVGSHVLESRSL